MGVLTNIVVFVTRQFSKPMIQFTGDIVFQKMTLNVGKPTLSYRFFRFWGTYVKSIFLIFSDPERKGGCRQTFL